MRAQAAAEHQPLAALEAQVVEHILAVHIVAAARRTAATILVGRIGYCVIAVGRVAVVVLLPLLLVLLLLLVLVLVFGDGGAAQSSLRQ